VFGPISLNTSSGCSSESGAIISTSLVAVKITAAESPLDFYVQKISAMDDYRAFQDKIQERAKAIMPLTTIQEGVFCIAFNQKNNIWCRGVILNCDDVCANVKCVDDGEIFKVRDKSLLKISSIEFIWHQYYGMRCTLSMNIPDTLIYDSTLCFRAMTQTNPMMRIITPNADINVVEIVCDGRNVTEDLVKKGFGKLLPVMAKGSAYINYIKDTDDFSIQMDASALLLAKIVKFCESSKPLSHIDDPQVGMLVEAHCPKYGTWNRAKILSINPNDYLVDFIDFGHNQRVEKIGKINDAYIESIPPIAIRCKLHKSSTNQSVEERFKEFSAKGLQKFTVSMVRIEENGRVVVDLFYKGQNILAFLSDPSKNIPTPTLSGESLKNC
jgi:Tudor domain